MPDFSAWFYDGWPSLLRVLLVGTCAYAGLVVLLRISGKRTLAKLNAFDLVVTVALGSTLATTLLGNDIALAEGLAAFALLILIQWAVAWTCARSRLASRLVKNEPRVIVWRGELLDHAIRSERLSREEVLSAIRAAGHGGYANVAAGVLETTGDMSVVPTLAGVRPALEPEKHPEGNR